MKDQNLSMTEVPVVDEVKSESLAKKAGKIQTRLKNAESIKTASGLQKLRDNAQVVLNELNSEKAIQQERSDNGDELDQAACKETIAKLDTKIGVIQEGINSLPGIAKKLLEVAD